MSGSNFSLPEIMMQYFPQLLKKLLKQRVVNFKSSGEGLNNTIKRMKRRVYKLDLELSELQRQNTRAHEDVESIKAYRS